MVKLTSHRLDSLLVLLVLSLLLLQAGDDLLLLFVNVVVKTQDLLLRPNVFLDGLGCQRWRRWLLGRRRLHPDRLSQEIVSFENLEANVGLIIS